VRVFVSGATGFIGQRVVARLVQEGHAVVAWVRSPERARQQLGESVELLMSGSGQAQLVQALERCDAVLNLAGEGLFARRWTRAFKQRLLSSRVETTARLVEALALATPRPATLVSASGAGYYGDRGDDLLTEASARGDDFLARLSEQWEEQAARAEELGVRVVRLRIGTVLGAEGGALERLLPLYRRGLGGRIASGQQQMSWIHVHDLEEIIVRALSDTSYRGPINAVAPHPVSNADFARTLARAVGRRALLPVPAAVLRLRVGEAAAVLLASQRVVPGALQQLGFRFRFPELGPALADLVARSADAARVRPGQLADARKG
jgi:uncharacterized protein (TIGR01777 family)